MKGNKGRYGGIEAGGGTKILSTVTEAGVPDKTFPTDGGADEIRRNWVLPFPSVIRSNEANSDVEMGLFLMIAEY